MPMFVHLLPSRQEYNCKLLCVPAANGFQIYLEGNVSEVRQRVQAPCLVWILPGGCLPCFWDFQLSHHIHLSPNESCPKVANHCHVFSPRANQGLHTSNSFRQLCQISLLIDQHQVFGLKHEDASGRNTVRPQFHRDLKPPQPSQHLPFLPLTCPFAGIAPSIHAASQSTGWKKWSSER